MPNMFNGPWWNPRAARRPEAPANGGARLTRREKDARRAHATAERRFNGPWWNPRVARRPEAPANGGARLTRRE